MSAESYEPGARLTDNVLLCPNTTFELSGIDIFEFEDGRVIQHWHETDHLVLFRQLGARLAPADD